MSSLGRGANEMSPSRVVDDDGIVRRMARANTITHYNAPENNWEEAGAEPGIDTAKEAEPHFSSLQQECQITVVDFSSDRLEKYELNNVGLIEFLKNPKEDWVGCRWINVNGLSWDVIRSLGNIHRLHRLAVEDLINTKGRTKADWYTDHG
jgi:hypothetical protein